MKKLSFFGMLLLSSMFAVLTYSVAGTNEKITVLSSSNLEKTLDVECPDLTGYEEQVKVKISERDHISVNSILTCYFYGYTTECYGRYNFTTALNSGQFHVTAIIEDDVEGF